MANQMPMFSAPTSDYGADISEIERRRAMALAMQQQSMQPIQSMGPPGSRLSPFQGLAKIMQGYQAGALGKDADQQQRELATRSRADLADVLRRGSQAASGAPAIPMPAEELGGGPGAPAQAPDPNRAAEIYMGNPMTAPMGMQMAQQGMADQRRKALLAQIMGPQGGGAAPAEGAPGGAPQQGGGVDPRVQALLLSGDPGLVALGQRLAAQGEAHRGVEYDQDGRGFLTTKGGQKIYIGVNARDKGVAVDTGPTTEFRNPYTNAPIGAPIQKGLNPMQSAQLPMEQGRFTFETGMRPPGPQTPPFAGAPSAPQAAQQPQPGPAPMPGVTPKDAAAIAKARAESMPQAQQAVELQGQDLDRLSTLATELKAHPGLARASGAYGMLPSIPGGDAAQAQALVDSLKAQVSGIKLQAMRNASKTGGAVGNVTEKEWPRLENMITALDPVKMGKATFQAKLDELVGEMAKMKKSLNDAFANEYGQQKKRVNFADLP